MTTNVYTFEDVIHRFVPKMATVCVRRYRLYRLSLDDFQQEMYVWLFGPGEAKVRRWLAADPQQTFRIYRSLLDVGLKWGEREKAEKCGYHPDDVFWYTPNMIEALMPLVLDEAFTEESGKVGELITSVIDVRKQLTEAERKWFLDHDSTSVGWDDMVRGLINKLGGDRPYVGRRRVMSNAQSQAITKDVEHG